MRSVGIKVLKNKLSEYVRVAEAGETVLVTDRDRVVAELGPPQSNRHIPEDPVLARGVREGGSRRRKSGMGARRRDPRRSCPWTS